MNYYWAHKGEGAWNNNQRLRVSQRDKLDGSMFTTGVQIKHPDILSRKELLKLLKCFNKTSVQNYGLSCS